MIINCGFELRIKKNNYKHKNVTNIEIPNGLSNNEILKELQNSVPDDGGWRIDGYCIIKEIS